MPGTPEKAKTPLRKWLRSGCFFIAGYRKSPEIKGFRAKRKGRQFLSKLPTFCGGEGGIRTLDTLVGYTRFPIVRARPATRLLHKVAAQKLAIQTRRSANQLGYNTRFYLKSQGFFAEI